MHKLKILIILFAGLWLASCQRDAKPGKPYTVAFYNVENLFDTIDTPGKIDEEFLPSSYREWNSERYDKKLDDLSRVIHAIDSVNLPVILGVCEIENGSVLTDLAKQSRLAKANYQVVWEDGPDVRGIDCALLYNPQAFELVAHESLPVVNPLEPGFLTRDILYVKGMLDKELFHFFVNHWPSRRGGEAASEPNRVLAAQVLRNKVDEIFEADSMANIIIMGDMNDEPDNMSLSDVLMALPNDADVENRQLLNLMYDDMLDGKGSYNYRGDWNMIDNMVVSCSLVNKEKGLSTSTDDGTVFHLPFMEFVNDKGEMSPNRTYGRTYYGGISDHFPIYMTLE
ncbi:endonuclease/exonuclease/phosphatase family protein [Roseimarinus sediminis]|uniref:endonuclease/exonuclease/phosphatase family protein n=1 Tax=Roseimarinus sediminis TaxID=1610899 RepID=UPI003D248BF9